MLKKCLLVLLLAPGGAAFAAKGRPVPGPNDKYTARVAPVPPGAKTHTVVAGDYLWNLAKRYYDSHFRWKAIHAANPEIIEDPHWIFPGEVLIIPDLPGDAIGALPARPIESSASIDLPAPDMPAAPPAPARSAAPPPQQVPLRDDLATEMPPQMTGQYPSTTRHKVPKDWKDDGQIVEFEGREIMAAQGDRIQARLKEPAVVGEKFAVYRRDSRDELDEKGSLYLHRVGVVEVEGAAERGRTIFRIVKSGDAIQLGDMLKREQL